MNPEDRLKPHYMTALRLIRKYLVHKGRPPSVREIQRHFRYASPRSAAFLLEKLEERGLVVRKKDGALQLKKWGFDDRASAQTVDVPLVGIAACGLPLLAEQNIDGMISVSTKLAKAPYRYFLLKAKGDSMNREGIEDGDLVLVRQQSTAEDGEKVVALIDDEATIKFLRKGKDTIRLEPSSTNRKHQPIILQRDFQVQGIVIGTV